MDIGWMGMIGVALLLAALSLWVVLSVEQDRWIQQCRRRNQNSIRSLVDSL